MHIQRAGLILGFIAWCMQLIVFVQPFLPGGTVSGFGVCQTVVAALAPAATGSIGPLLPVALAPEAPPGRPQLARPLPGRVAQDAQPPEMQAAQQGHAGHPVLQGHTLPKQDAHHFSHAACGFCTLYGHGIPPPWPVVLWFSQVERPVISLAVHRFILFYPPLRAYLKPPSHAPPR